jgi:hypothetical protein
MQEAERITQAQASATLLVRADAQQRERIRRHFRDHLNDLEYKHGQMAARLARERNLQKHNEERIRSLENEILDIYFEAGESLPTDTRQEFGAAGNGSARHPMQQQSQVYGRTAIPDVARKVGGSDFSDVMAKPSPLRLMNNGQQCSRNGQLDGMGIQLHNCKEKGKVKKDSATEHRFEDEYAVKEPPQHPVQPDYQTGHSANKHEEYELFSPEWMTEKIAELQAGSEANSWCDGLLDEVGREVNATGWVQNKVEKLGKASLRLRLQGDTDKPAEATPRDTPS